MLWDDADGFRAESLPVPNFAVSGLRGVSGYLAHEVHGCPSSHLWVVGVTGTNGKTTVTQWLARALSHVDSEKLSKVLLEREKIGSTAIGEGVAIPHGKLPEVDRVYGVFARSPEGVDFDSVDGYRTHLFFLLVAPENSPGDHLKALARISRLLQDADFRARPKLKTVEPLSNSPVSGELRYFGS